jgi:hypothetical protein
MMTAVFLESVEGSRKKREEGPRKGPPNLTEKRLFVGMLKWRDKN